MERGNAEYILHLHNWVAVQCVARVAAFSNNDKYRSNATLTEEILVVYLRLTCAVKP
jgi:hypothetical protein